MKKGGQKVLKAILNFFLVLIILVAAAITIVSLSTKEKGVANIMGYIPFSIQTESMEPVIMTGDLVITKKLDNQELKEDDVISFFSIEQNKKIIKTHRIIKVIQNGVMTSYVTKGDNNEYADDVEVAPGDVISIYSGTRIPKVGYALDFFKSKYGFLFCIILPLFGFFIYQLYSFVVLIIDSKKHQ